MGAEIPTLRNLDDLEARVPPGEHRPFLLVGSESFTGMLIRIPLFVQRGIEPGPAVFLTAALHGNEINGTGAIRELITDPEFMIQRGMLYMVPVVNVLGFERHSRYLPDRRDLNRCFPGSAAGSLTSRMARTIFDQVVRRCDYGIDLHTAAVRRTNFPNLRGDLSHPGVRRLAEAFGCPWTIASKGPRGSLRREATAYGIPTIILEAGEVWKVEPTVVAASVRGIKNVLTDLGMIEGPPEGPAVRVVLRRTFWTRAERGGFLQFHTSPGQIVHQGQPLATNTSLLGAERNVITSPFDAVVIGMTTLPAVNPGEPVCHLGYLDGDAMRRLAESRSLREDPIEQQLREHLATNVNVVERSAEDPPPQPGDHI